MLLSPSLMPQLVAALGPILKFIMPGLEVLLGSLLSGAFCLPCSACLVLFLLPTALVPLGVLLGLAPRPLGL